MPAYSKEFPWPSYYGHFSFFEERMKGHGRVSKISALGNGVYELTLVSGKTIRAFICECYSYGVAEYIETIEKLGRVDAVIISSAWCGYTLDAKRLCRDQKVGLFNIRDFMAAINKEKYWLHLNEKEIEHFKKEIRL